MNYDQPLTPSLNHRFLAFFSLGHIPDPISLRFSKISGLGRQIEIQQINEGGHNHRNRFLPGRVSIPNLVFERGVMMVTPLTLATDMILSGFYTRLMSYDILIMLLDAKGIPEASWSANGAMPVSMSMGTLDADSGQVLMNSMEFACSSVEWLGAKL